MSDVNGYAGLLLLIGVVGLAAVLSNRITGRVPVSAPMLAARSGCGAGADLRAPGRRQWALDVQRGPVHIEELDAVRTADPEQFGGVPAAESAGRLEAAARRETARTTVRTGSEMRVQITAMATTTFRLQSNVHSRPLVSRFSLARCR